MRRDQQDIVITNNNDIISLADILNNSNYEITNKTKKIIITSSYWNIESISEISKHHQINNQKTLRLTKGIDQSLIETALEKATFLIQQLTDGIVHKNIMSQKIQKYHNPFYLYHPKPSTQISFLPFSFSSSDVFIHYIQAI
ncbi:MAG: phenylalanine--tRNA ligase beta subunit-related protein, partial [Sweet potato little leaf phytoplasma]|nr:phenylalanine--tRNA ligase beta subunit-related protein [Sweet potato little leaf phytoplasma]